MLFLELKSKKHFQYCIYYYVHRIIKIYIYEGFCKWITIHKPIYFETKVIKIKKIKALL